MEEKNKMFHVEHRAKLFVVEGKNDYAKLKSIDNNLNIITTNGSEISKETLNEIIIASETKTIVLLLDPDGPGEKIRKKIQSVIKQCEHIFVPQNIAISKNKKKVGIEHIKTEILTQYLGETRSDKKKSDVTLENLYDLNLIGKPNSNALRSKLCNKLMIGKANGKTLLSKINMFGINYSEIEKIIKGENDDNR